MSRFVLIATIAIFLFSCPAQGSENYDLVITNVGLFDGITDKGEVNVAIKADSIAKISTDHISGDSVIDGKGKYLIPGLINAHVHATKPEDLKSAIQSGIVLVLDLHQSSEKRAALLRSYRDSTDHASFYSSGFSATLPNGHPTQYGEIETISNSLTAGQWVQNRLNNGADFIKIIRETGGGPPDFQEIPTLEFNQIQEIIKSADAHQKVSVAHTSTLEETMIIAELGVDGFAHLWMGTDSASDQQLKLLKELNVFVIPTAQTQLEIWRTKVDGAPQRIKEYAHQNLSTMELIKSELARIHEAEIPILAGNDPPNFDIGYGEDLLVELGIYSEAGLSNIEVLKTATGNPAKAFKLNSYGRIKENMPANLVLIDGNPLEDLEALKKIQYIWKKGKEVKLR